MDSSDLSLCLLENAYDISVSIKGGRVFGEQSDNYYYLKKISAACEEFN